MECVVRNRIMADVERADAVYRAAAEAAVDPEAVAAARKAMLARMDYLRFLNALSEHDRTHDCSATIAAPHGFVAGRG